MQCVGSRRNSNSTASITNITASNSKLKLCLRCSTLIAINHNGEIFNSTASYHIINCIPVRKSNAHMQFQLNWRWSRVCWINCHNLSLQVENDLDSFTFTNSIGFEFEYQFYTLNSAAFVRLEPIKLAMIGSGATMSIESIMNR